MLVVIPFLQVLHARSAGELVVFLGIMWVLFCFGFSAFLSFSSTEAEYKIGIVKTTKIGRGIHDVECSTDDILTTHHQMTRLTKT